MYKRIDNSKYIDIYTNNIITDSKIIEWIKSLKIPPNYKNVHINKKKDAKILAYGYDNKNRKQYIYNSIYIEKRKKDNFEKIIMSHDIIKSFLKIIEKNLLNKDNKIREIAIIIFLIINCGFRIGNKKYTNINNPSYGITTLLFKHISFVKKSIIFEFIGKKGVINRGICNNINIFNFMYKKFTNKSSENDNIFTVSSNDVNNYIKEYNKKLTSKDLRTWNANVLFIEYIKEEIENQSNNPINKALKRVSKNLHNTPNVCKKNYIDPLIISKIKNDLNI